MHLFQELTPNTTLLTPNSRLSRALLQQYNAWQIAQGKSCWPSLDILPLTSWLQRLWHVFTAHHITTHPTLLTPSQEQLIWEEILRQSPENAYLLQLSNTAELAKSAWETLKKWRVDLTNAALITTEDSLIFHTWAKQFAALCKQHHWLDTHSLPDVIIEKIQTRLITPPSRIVLTGFTEIAPQYQHLFSICAEFGSEIITHESDQRNNTISRICLADQETEIVTLARWAKTTLENNPGKSIGCVIPALDTLRDRVLPIFADVFSAENTLTVDYATLPLNISAGKRLSDYPVIHTALQILHLHTKTVSINTLSQLLRSPFLGEAEQEMVARAQFENTLRAHNINTISLHKLLQKNDNIDLAHHCKFLATRMQQLLDETQYLNQMLPTSAWVTIFMNLLTMLGWPGERSLNSHEYQVVKDSWFKLLNTYAACDNLLGSLSYHQALHYLTYLAKKEMFQPESPSGAPIQILGTLEAADIPFDFLWVMGMDDSAWPPAPKPNPFIPQRLQRSLQMPRATAERELIYYQYLTKQLTRSADHIIFSHAAHDADTELRISPIISHFPEVTLDHLSLTAFNQPAQTIYAASNLECINDETAPQILPDEKIRGGTSIFKLQAACPFKAFAELRLYAKKMDSPTLGLEAKNRGNIVHNAMELIWKSLQDQETLLEQHPDTLRKLIHDSVEYALNHDTSEALKNSRYRELEALRLKIVLQDWLEKEKLRSPFKVIALEEQRQAIIGTIPITLQIDRIDELDNRKQVIIDYKTGKDNTADAWFGDRPDEPQLPLYCITRPENVTGLLFGQINPEKMKWEGVSESPINIASVKPLEKIKCRDADSWSEQIQRWQITLDKLGNDFAHGNATVDPKDPVETCRYCHLQTVCRVHESC